MLQFCLFFLLWHTSRTKPRKLLPIYFVLYTCCKLHRLTCLLLIDNSWHASLVEEHLTHDHEQNRLSGMRKMYLSRMITKTVSSLSLWCRYASAVTLTGWMSYVVYPVLCFSQAFVVTTTTWACPSLVWIVHIYSWLNNYIPSRIDYMLFASQLLFTQNEQKLIYLYHVLMWSSTSSRTRAIVVVYVCIYIYIYNSPPRSYRNK